jgi:hypothetical protein
LFADIPKIFDRNFIIAFFLPAVVFVGASVWLLSGFNLLPTFLSFQPAEVLKNATTLSVISWLIGILLLVLNYAIYQFIEGYGTYNPMHWLEPLERRRYQRIRRSRDKLEEEYEEGLHTGESADYLNKLLDRQMELERQLVEEFPIEDRLLNTSFGNAVRAFEDYPWRMYGVDSIVVWVRLLAVIPDNYRELVDTAKAQTDFWLNLWLVAIMAIMEYVAVLLYARDVAMLWFPLLFALLVRVASARARTAAVHWGDYVKASFDLFLPALREKLQLPAPENIREERKLWTNFSQVVIYHEEDQVMSRVPPKSDDKEEKTFGRAGRGGR